MSYSKDNLILLSQGLKGDFKQWAYRSADSFATVKAAGYISDAQSQGMNVRDTVMVVDTNTPATTIANVLAVSSSGATLSTTGVVVAE